MILLIAFIMALAFGAVWYFTTYENTLIERSLTSFVTSLEAGMDKCLDGFYSVKNRLIVKSEL